MGKKKIDINAKNVNNAVKNNANMDGWNELVQSAKEFREALDDEVANREYERKKSEFLHKPFWLGREDFLTYKGEEEQKLKPASDVESLKAELENLKAHFEGVCAERDNLAACLESCERDLKRKEKVIERIKKKNAKRMAEKCEVIKVLNEEIVFQYKRREKAEKFVNTLGQAFDLLKKNVEDYEHSIGR